MKIQASVARVPSNPAILRRSFQKPSGEELDCAIDQLEELRTQRAEKEIRISIYDPALPALHLEPWQHCDWRTITSILNVEGVRYYTIDRAIGVRYKEGTDFIHVAAICVIVIAECLNTPVSEIKVVDTDSFAGKIDSNVAEQIWTRAQTIQPPPKPLGRVVARGTGPAYWREEIFLNQ